MTTYTKLLLKNNKVQLRNGKALAKGRGLYTPAEITDMINIDGYIPVASATELDNLRNAVSQTMGAGTQWEGTYTTGLDKKYVQVRDIDLSGFANWASLGAQAQNSINVYEYDGNKLIISNLTGQNPLFGHLAGAVLKNIRLIDSNISSINVPKGILASAISSTSVRNNIIDDIIISGMLTGSSVCGAILGISSFHNFENLISNTYCYCNMTSTGDRVGGLIGETSSKCILHNCYFQGSVISASESQKMGGIVGYNRGTVKNSNALVNSIRGNSIIGGIVGDNKGIVKFCFSSGIVTATSNTLNSVVGGLCGTTTGGTLRDSKSDTIAQAIGAAQAGVGGAAGACGSSGVISNVLSYGGVISNNSIRGGLVGYTGGTITNSYYDSDTSGQSDTGKGEPRTTKQLQNGTADSFINPDGSVDLTESSANAMFTAWDNTIWKFNPNNKYPRLR